MLKDIFEHSLLKAKAVFGLFPANTVNDDDIELTHEGNKYSFLTLRQQLKKREGVPNFALECQSAEDRNYSLISYTTWRLARDAYKFHFQLHLTLR